MPRKPKATPLEDIKAVVEVLAKSPDAPDLSDIIIVCEEIEIPDEDLFQEEVKVEITEYVEVYKEYEVIQKLKAHINTRAINAEVGDKIMLNSGEANICKLYIKE